MSNHRSRRPCRYRRPAPPSPTRAQVRQRITRLSVLYKLEALLELQKPEPDAVHLGQLNEIWTAESNPRFSGRTSMKRAAIYMRVSTVDQHPETQLLDLRQMAAQRGYEIVHEYTDRISGTKAKRPGLDQMMRDARRGQFDVVLVWACDRIARSTRHFLDVLDDLNRLNIEFISFREQIDTGGPLGRAIVVIIGAIAELERSLIVERVRAGMRRAKLEGRSIGRRPLELDHDGIERDREQGQSLRQIAQSTSDLAGNRTTRASPQPGPRHQLDYSALSLGLFRKGLENRPNKPHKTNSRI